MRYALTAILFASIIILTANTPVIAQTTSFTTNILDPNMAGDVKDLGDIDGDGYLDGVIGGHTGTENMVWFKYNPVPKTWTKYPLATATSEFTTDMQLGDIDNDGDLDVIVPEEAPGLLMWIENPRPNGNPSNGNWTRHNIATGMGHLHDLEVADFDRDGKLDIITRHGTFQTSDGNVFIYFQNSPNSWTSRTFPFSHGEGLGIGDIDRDNDIDFIVAGKWYENPASPRTNPWTAHGILPNPPSESTSAVADFNTDGKPDIVIVNQHRSDTFAWYEGPDNPKTAPTGSFTQHVINTNTGSHKVNVADFNKDGRIDIQTSLELSDMKIHYNTGGQSPTFTTQTLPNSAHNARVGDIGNDGDIDIFGANWTGNPPTRVWINSASGPITPTPTPQWKLFLSRWFTNLFDRNSDGTTNILDWLTQLSLPPITNTPTPPIQATSTPTAPPANPTATPTSPAAASCTRTISSSETIETHFNQLNPGQTLCLSTGTYAQTLNLTKSGTSAGLLRLQPAPNATVKITGEPNVEHLVLLTADYTEISGITFERTTSNWPSGYYGWIQIINGADHNIFRNNKIQIATTDPHSLDMNYREDHLSHGILVNNSTGNQILNNYIRGMGHGIRTNNLGNKTLIVRGNHIYRTWSHGMDLAPPAQPLQPQGILIDNNIFEYSFKSDGIQFFNGTYGEQLVHQGIIIRNNIFKNNQENALDTKGATRNLIEKNIFYGTTGDNDGAFKCGGNGECINGQDRSSHSVKTHGANTHSEYNIFRFNVFYDNPAFHIVTGDKVYNNTFINNNRDFTGANSQWTGRPGSFYAIAASSPTNIGIKNNIIAQHNFAEIGFNLPLSNADISYNQYWNTNQVRFKPDQSQTAPLSNLISLPQWQTQTGEHHSFIQAPQFVQVPTTFRPTGDHTQFDFHLANTTNNPARDAGTPVTRTRSAGSGTTVPVQDVTYFYHGHNVLPGDLIQFGTNSTKIARVTNINYTTNTITIDRNLNWTANESVSLPFNGSAPDLGAFEL